MVFAHTVNHVIYNYISLNLTIDWFVFASGRVLNRFSKDIGFMDDLLPYVFCEYLIVSVVCVCVVHNFVSVDTNSCLYFC